MGKKMESRSSPGHIPSRHLVITEFPDGLPTERITDLFQVGFGPMRVEAQLVRTNTRHERMASQLMFNPCQKIFTTELAGVEKRSYVVFSNVLQL
jgi:hypothetical protein